MFVIISDIFSKFGLITGVTLTVMGLWYQGVTNFSNILVIISIVYILLTLFVIVSYWKGEGIKIELVVISIVVALVAWGMRIFLLYSALPVMRPQKVGFTGLSRNVWQIQPDVKYGIDEDRYVLCELSDSGLCVPAKASNLLFYQSYSLCNIKGDLFYKVDSEIKTYDYVKKTFLYSYQLELECEPTWISKIFDTRDYIISKIGEILPRPQSTLLSGIIFGINVSFYPKFDNAIRAAGISHIVAASGYNVNILINALLPFTSRLGKRIGLLINIFSIWFYALLTGFSSSMVRACAMSTVLFLSKYFDMGVDIRRVFILTISILIFINPFIVYDLGFLLSAGATYGVIYLSPLIENLLPYKWFPHATFACTLVTLPITIFFFKSFSPYSVIANMLILPVIEVVMLLGIFGLVLKPLLYIAWGCLRYVEIVSLYFAKLPYSIIDIPDSVSPYIAIVLILLIYLISKQDKK